MAKNKSKDIYRYQINFLNNKKMIVKEQVLGLVRHALTFVGGLLIAKGLLSDSNATDLIGGLMTVVGTVWSVLSKKTA